MEYLKDWVKSNQVKETMYYCGSARKQFNEWEWLSKCLDIDSPLVISIHCSKSIILPVVQYTIGTIKIMARDNFHNIQVAVDSQKPVYLRNETRFRSNERYLNSIYFEGFKEEWVFKQYSTSNNMKFSLSLDNISFIDLVFQLRENYFTEEMCG